MKHLIIMNPRAGEDNKIGFDIKGEVLKNFLALDYEIFETTGPRSATEFLKQYFKKHNELTRVYACGGDGTIHEVVNGIVGVKNAELAILPIGTGNDFVKIYGASNEEIGKYRNFKPLIDGEAKPIDLSKISGGHLQEPLYSINVINFGFDAIVGAKGNQNKLKGKKNPYGPAAIIPALLRGRFNKTIVKADGEQLNKKRLLLASLAQGQWVGGQYHASPKSDNTDGLIDVVILRCMSLARLMIQYFGKYQQGQHLDNEKLMKRIVYRRAKNIEIIAPKDIDICIDGEMIRGDHFDVEVVPNAIKLVAPEAK